MITIRKFERYDIPRKVEWINDTENNQYLPYELPLSVEKTERWFDSHVGDTGRFDAVIEADHVPVGTIGLLSIDQRNKKAEFYIAIGQKEYKGKGVGTEASRLVLKYGFEDLGLNKIYFYTETGNIAAQKLYEKLGFKREGELKSDVFSHGRFVDNYVYGLLKKDWEKQS